MGQKQTHALQHNWRRLHYFAVRLDSIQCVAGTLFFRGARHVLKVRLLAFMQLDSFFDLLLYRLKIE